MKRFDTFGEYMFDLMFAPLKKGRRAVNQFAIFFRVVGREFDDLKTAILRVRDEANVASASEVMLPIHGQDRDMLRLIGESVEGYRTRLAMKGIIASWAGTSRGILYAMAALGYEHSTVEPVYPDDPDRWAEFTVRLGPGKSDSVKDFFIIYEEIQKVKAGSSRLVCLSFTQKPATDVLHFGGTVSSISTLPVPEGADEIKWLDKLRVGGTAAMLSVLPVPELT